MSGPTYTYTANTPQAATPFNQTQNPILNNFRAINELFNVNHGSFNTSNAGKHNNVSMQYQTDVPPVQTNEITMFVQQTSGGPNAAEIFITYPNSSTGVEISNQPASTPSGTSSGNATAGYCQFPSGVIIRWGTFATSGTSPSTFTAWTGPNYTTYMLPGAITPTSSGSNTVTAATMSTSSNGTEQGFYPQLYGYSGSPSTLVNFNYLTMGY